MRMRERYKINKSAKVGDKLVCPSCGTEFVKTNYQQAFCKSKSKTVCKDKFWNTVDPEKRNNTTRISPANQAWMDKRDEERNYRDIYDDFHPFEGLSDNEYKNH